MKTAELVKKLRNIMSAERKAQIKKYDSLKKVLKSLRIEKHLLKDQLAETGDEEKRRELESRLVVVSEQRKKGLKLLAELKKERG